MKSTVKLSFNKKLPISLVDFNFFRIFAPYKEEPVPKTTSSSI